MMKVTIIVLGTVATCWAGGCTANSAGTQVEKETCPVDVVLKQLNQKTTALKSYRGRIEYLFGQPLLDSQTLRKGMLYYQRDNGKSKLRINFQTLKQDDEEEQKYIEQYIFDGVWLTHIDYQIEQVKRYQQAEPNEPVDAFDLVSQNFPIIGFSKVEELKSEFEIKLIEKKRTEPSRLIWLNLRVKPDSIYKNDYTSMDLWVDKKSYLPAAIRAISTEEDFCAIKLLKPKINKAIDKKVFEVKIPEGFGEEVIPLKKKGK